MPPIGKILSFDTFPFLCRLVACALLAMALTNIGFPPTENIGTTALTLLIFSIFFLLLPIAKKISIGKLISFEREVEKIAGEVKEFKSETREFLGVYSSMLNTISNTVQQTVNVHYPNPEEARQAKEDLEAAIETPDEPGAIEDDVSAFIAQAGGDYNFALAKLRMELEQNLRNILGKRTITPDPTKMVEKFLSARQLFRELTISHQKYMHMRSSFDYILKICNAAIHGQQVSEPHAHEAIYMGLQIIDELKKDAKL
ncbi:hypothetical protein RHP75_02180 [Pseudomonas sp. SG20056]|uniref:hypothetical protein n=1 Tax=Pseudomonas sp. SG20056 TaxID=3074146 RepID=UPI00287F4197|nr:hypothetical protein [Pseudomonas sp. SG20056]WNF47267.1 hypothetical protein RHP75_02180 [Pseudomonas sp. SG20056]